MFQFHIKKYGTVGDGSAALGALPFQVFLRCLGTSDAQAKYVWIKDYDTLANAKTGAAALFATGTVTPWVDSGASSESLSAIFTPTI